MKNCFLKITNSRSFINYQKLPILGSFIKSHFFQSTDKYAHFFNSQTSDLLGIIIKNYKTQDHLSRFIIHKSSIESYFT